jgi:chaperonin GroES
MGALKHAPEIRPPVIRPVGDRVLVARVEPAGVTQGGILLLEDAREPTHLATVLAAGPGARDRKGQRRAMPVKAGDRVLLHMLAGARSAVHVVSHGEDAQFVHARDILGVIAPGATLTVTQARTWW